MMDFATAVDFGRAAKAAWDAGDTAGYVFVRDQLAAWAVENGWTLDEAADGFLSIIRDGAAEMLL